MSTGLRIAPASELIAMGWIARLFGARCQKAAQQQKSADSASPLDSSSDPGTTRVRPPRKKARTAEERKADWHQYCQEMQSVFRASFQRDRKNALAAGSTKYVWRSSGDEDVCPACAKKNGRRFAWNSPPVGGHPGESGCCPSGWCRCYAEAVIAD
jgi:hypothetical protein